MTILRPLVTLFCVANTRLEIWSHLYACMSMSIKLLAAIGPFLAVLERSVSLF